MVETVLFVLFLFFSFMNQMNLDSTETEAKQRRMVETLKHTHFCSNVRNITYVFTHETLLHSLLSTNGLFEVFAK